MRDVVAKVRMLLVLVPVVYTLGACAAPVEDEATAGAEEALIACPSCFQMDRPLTLASGTYDTTGTYVVDPQSGVHGSVSMSLFPIGGVQIAGTSVEVDFSACGDLVSICPSTDGFDVDAPVVHGVLEPDSDPTRSRIDIPIAGTIRMPVSEAERNLLVSCASVRVDSGIALFGAITTHVQLATPDLDGSGEVTAADLSVFLDVWGNVAYDPRVDYDGSGNVTAADLSVWLGFYSSGASVIGCPTVLCYPDEDADGFALSTGVLSPSDVGCPAGEVVDPPSGPSDCADYEAAAHPGQSGWFSSPYYDEVGPTFDYDCSGAAERRDTRMNIVNILGCFPGWTVSVPACGDLGQWNGCPGLSLRRQACH